MASFPDNRLEDHVATSFGVIMRFHYSFFHRILKGRL